MDEFIRICSDINTFISFDELISTNISVILHPYRFTISKNKTPGSISIFCTYNGYILASKYTYDINIFDREIDISYIGTVCNGKITHYEGTNKGKQSKATPDVIKKTRIPEMALELSVDGTLMNDITVTVTEQATNRTRTLFIRHRFVF